MNIRYDFTKLGGFPFAQDAVLKDMQNSYRNAFAAIANMIGSKVIITGMDEAGGNVTSGWIAVNGELMPFIGGAIGDGSIIVVEAGSNRTFQDGNSKEVRFEKIARFGSPGTYQYSDFRRINGVVNFWQPGDLKMCQLTMGYITTNFDNTGLGINERTGWAVCNGQNGTINMANKLPLGYNWANIAGMIDAVGNSKGSALIQKTNLPNSGVGYEDWYYPEKNSVLAVLGASNKKALYGYNNNTGSSGSDKDNDYVLYRNAITSPLGDGTVYYPDSIITLYLKKL